MIGWKCEIGIFPNGVNGDFVVTDKTIIPFLQVQNLPNDVMNMNPAGGNVSSTIYHSYHTAANENNVLFLEKMVELLGDEYGFVNFMPLRIPNGNIVQVFKSAWNYYPNFIEKYASSPNGTVTGIYIPGLKRYIVGDVNVNSVTAMNIYGINKNNLGQFIFSVPVCNYPNKGSVVIYNGGNSYEDFVNPENYQIILVLARGGTTANNSSGYTISNYSSGYGSLKSSLIALFGDFTPPDAYVPTNPYEPGGPSIPGDLPPGTFDDTSDPIPDSSLPTISAANTGFTRIYNPTLSQVQNLARYLWTTEDIISTLWNHIKQYFEDPMQAIIGFNLVPVSVPDGGNEEFALMFIGTGVYMNVAASQFVDVDCGTYTLERYYGSALDQSPYTKVQCYLPYIGMVTLDTDEVMGATLQVKYRVDIVTGSCVAKILVDGSVLYQYSGHCAINIPISSADFSSYVSATINIAKLLAGSAANAIGVGAPDVPSVQQTTGNTTTITNTARNPETGRQITVGTQTITSQNTRTENTKASFDGLSPANVANTVGQVMSSKGAGVQHSGSFSGNSGYLGIRRPYLLIERPNMCLPQNYQALNGYPSMITMKLGSCTGFTRIQQVQLTGLSATNPEQAEIMQLLKSGVIL